MGYRIKTVAELTGIPRNTLLAWERRYGLLSPDRQVNGYREFSAQDVSVLREIKRLIDAGHKVSEAISLLGDRAKAMAAPPPIAERAEAMEPGGPAVLRSALLAELLSLQRARADRIVHHQNLLGYNHLILEVYFPLLRQIGEGWAAGEISVAQEHFASEFCREQMVAMLLSLECGPQDGPGVVAAGYPGERHDGGLLGLSVLLALRGWRLTYLGADVPLPDLLLLLQEAKPKMVCVGLLQGQPIGELVSYARLLRAGCALSSRVVIGGRGVEGQSLPTLPGVEWISSARRLLEGEGAGGPTVSA